MSNTRRVYFEDKSTNNTLFFEVLIHGNETLFDNWQFRGHIQPSGVEQKGLASISTLKEAARCIDNLINYTQNSFPEMVNEATSNLNENSARNTSEKIPKGHTLFLYNQNKSRLFADRLAISTPEFDDKKLGDSVRAAILLQSHPDDTWGVTGLTRLIELKDTIECAIETLQLTVPSIAMSASALSSTSEQLQNVDYTKALQASDTINKRIDMLENESFNCPRESVLLNLRRNLQKLGKSISHIPELSMLVDDAVETTGELYKAEQVDHTSNSLDNFEYLRKLSSIKTIKTVVDQQLKLEELEPTRTMTAPTP